MRSELLGHLKKIILGNDCILLSYKNQENSSFHLQANSNEIQIKNEEIIINSDTISASFDIKDKMIYRDDDDYIIHNEYEDILIGVL